MGNQLSGGMKVKVVLAGAMWQNPHVLVLDEPTNYLDRDGLGALSLAIDEFKGGVLVISHNREFCDKVATEKWIMQQGRLRIEGESIDDKDDKIEQSTGHDVIYDGSGNKIEIDRVGDQTEKAKKKEIKDVEKKLKDSRQKKKGCILTEEQIWELEDKLNHLKDSLVGKTKEVVKT